MINAFERELSRSYTLIGWKHFGKLAVIKRKQPYDFWAVVEGTHYGMEAKSTAGGRAFPFNRVEEHQKQGLLDCEKEGGIGWILLSFRKSPRIPLCAIGIRIKDYIQFEKEELAKGNKSISPMNYFSDNKIFVKIPRAKIDDEYVWDIRVLLPDNIRTLPRFENLNIKQGETIKCPLKKKRSTKSSRTTTSLRLSLSKKKAKK